MAFLFVRGISWWLPVESYRDTSSREIILQGWRCRGIWVMEWPEFEFTILRLMELMLSPTLPDDLFLFISKSTGYYEMFINTFLIPLRFFYNKGFIKTPLILSITFIKNSHWSILNQPWDWFVQNIFESTKDRRRFI